MGWEAVSDYYTSHRWNPPYLPPIEPEKKIEEAEDKVVEVLESETTNN